MLTPFRKSSRRPLRPSECVRLRAYLVMVRLSFVGFFYVTSQSLNSFYVAFNYVESSLGYFCQFSNLASTAPLWASPSNSNFNANSFVRLNNNYGVRHQFFQSFLDLCHEIKDWVIHVHHCNTVPAHLQ